MDAVKATIALARRIKEALSGSGNLRASRAGERLIEEVERLAGILDKSSLACRNGCASCCHQRVGVTAPEAFWMSRRASVVRAAKRLSGVGIAQPSAVCPFLRNETCTIYGARPSACRSYASTSAEACRSFFLRGQGDGVPMPDAWFMLRAVGDMAMAAGLAASGFPYNFYSMPEAVARVLSDPDSEARWLSGADVFAGVEILPPAPTFHGDVTFVLNSM